MVRFRAPLHQVNTAERRRSLPSIDTTIPPYWGRDCSIEPVKTTPGPAFDKWSPQGPNDAHCSRSGTGPRTWSTQYCLKSANSACHVRHQPAGAPCTPGRDTRANSSSIGPSTANETHARPPIMHLPTPCAANRSAIAFAAACAPRSIPTGRALIVKDHTPHPAAAPPVLLGSHCHHRTALPAAPASTGLRHYSASLRPVNVVPSHWRAASFQRSDP